jgi:hypothetical protein
MSQISSLNAPLQATSENGQLLIPVPPRSAEAVQSHLQREGIRTTVVLDPGAAEARLEVWPGSDAGGVQAALDRWED